jgi:hypothetical protein
MVQGLSNMARIKLRHRLDRMLGKVDLSMRPLYAFKGQPPAPTNDLERLFWGNNSKPLEKWLHYLPIYDHHLARYRGTGVRLLQIGTQDGAALKLWRQYLGPTAHLVGMDPVAEGQTLDSDDGTIRLGSPAEPGAMARVIEEMGGVDVVIDDGTHLQSEILAALSEGFPRLDGKGIYMVEDTHTSYWDNWEGGYGKPTTFMETVKVLMDDMHHWYHTFGEQVSATAGHLVGMHIYDSVVVLDKGSMPRPSRTTIPPRPAT